MIDTPVEKINSWVNFHQKMTTNQWLPEGYSGLFNFLTLVFSNNNGTFLVVFLISERSEERFLKPKFNSDNFFQIILIVSKFEIIKHFLTI